MTVCLTAYPQIKCFSSSSRSYAKPFVCRTTCPGLNTDTHFLDDLFQSQKRGQSHPGGTLHPISSGLRLILRVRVRIQRGRCRYGLQKGKGGALPGQSSTTSITELKDIRRREERDGKEAHNVQIAVLYPNNLEESPYLPPIFLILDRIG
jgi:hypothetical protein